MLDIEKEYKIKLNELRRLIRSTKKFDLVINLALEIHAITHTSKVSFSSIPTFCDALLQGLQEEYYSVMPTAKDETIAWHLWHIARIEDLVGNLLIAQQPQIFSDEWMTRLNVSVKDTGNVMSDEEIITLSKQLNKQELINYRNEVGLQTRNIIQSLSPNDLKRKPGVEYLNRLVSEGGLLECKDSIWLKDFWGKYTVSGLILLPLTYHHMLHLPDSIAIKRYCIENYNMNIGGKMNG